MIYDGPVGDRKAMPIRLQMASVITHTGANAGTTLRIYTTCAYKLAAFLVDDADVEGMLLASEFEPHARVLTLLELMSRASATDPLVKRAAMLLSLQM